MLVRPAVLVALALAVVAVTPGVLLYRAGGPEGGLLPSFNSYGEMAWFMNSRHPPGVTVDYLGRGGGPTAGAAGGSTGSFSGTNVQVAGVDEGDIVKTDGDYLYLATPEGVTVVRADPPAELRNVSFVGIRGALGMGPEAGWVQVVDLFVAPGKLAVLAAVQVNQPQPMIATAAPRPSIAWLPTDSRLVVAVFDLSVVEHPSLLSSHAISGHLLTSRMLDHRLFILAQSYVQKTEVGYLVPRVCEGSTCWDIEASRIHYDPEDPYPTAFLNVLTVDLDSQAFDYSSILGGYASTVYMSPGALYVTFQKRTGVVVAMGRPSVRSPSMEISTTIYRLKIDGLAVRAVARGDVPGRLLNQFSMDEDASFLRVATTVEGNATSNSVYVLDGDLAVVGSLADLAPGERIYSVRFLGDRAYVVTFRRVDPLFALDLADPKAPRMLGYLKIPGFSQYLHPIDGTRILGVGRETTDAAGGNFALVQGLKVSLFDVADPTHPREVSNYTIGDRGTWSEVLDEHKAFLYVLTHSMVVLPVDLVQTFGSPTGGYSTETWQGAYVLTVGADGGLSVKGRITHVPNPGDPAYPAYRGSPYAVRRALYIGDYLFTISASMVKVNSLADLAEVNSLLYTTEPSAWTKGGPVQG